MKTLFFILVTLFLIVLQTVIFPSFLIFSHCFDILIIEIFFLSLISRHHSTVFAIIAIGSLMDSISGVPFFYYIFSYLWIYIIVHLVKQFLFKQSFVFILCMSIIAVLIQQGLLLFSIFIKNGSDGVLAFDFSILPLQLILGLIFIPMGVWLLDAIWKIWKIMANELHKNITKMIED